MKLKLKKRLQFAGITQFLLIFMNPFWSKSEFPSFCMSSFRMREEQSDVQMFTSSVQQLDRISCV
jgi:hypothetical protein